MSACTNPARRAEKLANTSSTVLGASMMMDSDSDPSRRVVASAVRPRFVLCDKVGSCALCVCI